MTFFYALDRKKVREFTNDREREEYLLFRNVINPIIKTFYNNHKELYRTNSIDLEDLRQEIYIDIDESLKNLNNGILKRGENKDKRSIKLEKTKVELNENILSYKKWMVTVTKNLLTEHLKNKIDKVHNTIDILAFAEVNERGEYIETDPEKILLSLKDRDENFTDTDYKILYKKFVESKPFSTIAVEMSMDSARIVRDTLNSIKSRLDIPHHIPIKMGALEEDFMHGNTQQEDNWFTELKVLLIDTDYQIVHLRFVEQKSLKEIGSIVGMSHQNVQLKLNKILASLKKKLNKFEI